MLSAVRKDTLKKLFETLKIKTTDELLFEEALTHPSFNFESNNSGAPDYERLEFLGDSVLRLVMSDLLFDYNKNFDEGKLTKIRSYLVSDEFLAKLAMTIELNKYIKVGLHEAKDGGLQKESILACALEATFGAIYKSLGYEQAKTCIFNLYSSVNIDPEEVLVIYNAKEILQQYTQGKNKDLPQYKVISESGFAHNKIYEVSVSYNSEVLGVATAKTKKEAEKKSAINALIKLGIIKGKKDE